MNTRINFTKTETPHMNSYTLYLLLVRQSVSQSVSQSVGQSDNV